MKKYVVRFAVLICALSVAGSVYAFGGGGGGGGRKATEYKGGISTIGVHFGGDTTDACPDHSSKIDGLCTCDDGYTPDTDGQCVSDKCIGYNPTECKPTCDPLSGEGIAGNEGGFCDDQTGICHNGTCEPIVCNACEDLVEGNCVTRVCNDDEICSTSQDKCICDNANNYYGQPGSCSLCSGTGKIVSGNECVCDSNYDTIGGNCYAKCGEHAIHDPNNSYACACDNANKYYGPADDCKLCSGTGKVVVGNECVCDSNYDTIGGNCYAKCGEHEIHDPNNNYACACDNANKYYGQAGSCSLCSGTGKVVVGNACVCDSTNYDDIGGTCYAKCETWQTRDGNNECQDVICALNANIYDANDNQVCVCPEHRDTTGNICGDCISGTSWQTWTQPVLDSAHGNGTMGVDDFACNQSTYRGVRYAWRAFDGTNLDPEVDCWHNNDYDSPSWMSWYTSSPIKINTITIVNRPEGPETQEYTALKNFEIQYSDDNSNWNTQYSGVNPMGYGLSTTHNVNATTAHNYWRIYITTTYHNEHIAIGELIIDADTPQETASYVIDGDGMCQEAPSCPDGYTGDNCDECADGYEMFNSTCVLKCENGQYHDNNGLCQTCPGTLSGRTSEYVCLACTPGGYWTGSACKNPCAEGKFHILAGDCKACDPATYSTAAAATPAECALCGDLRRVFEVTEAESTSYYCAPKDCDSGEYHANTGTCRSCSSYTAPSTVEECAVCAGYGTPRYVDSGDENKCKKCPANMASATSADSCEQCFGGVFEGGVCTEESENPCPEGETPYISYRGESNTETSCCPAGSVVHEGAGANGADMCCLEGESVYCNARDGNGNCYTGSMMCCPAGSNVYEGVGYNGADLCCEAGYEAWGGSCVEACPTGQVRNQSSGICETPASGCDTTLCGTTSSGEDYCCPSTATVCNNPDAEELDARCVTVTSGCTKNSDCGEGQFCYLTANNWDGSGMTGNCTAVSNYGPTTRTFQVGTYTHSTGQMNWWSANNWCAAQGLRLPSTTDLCGHVPNLQVGSGESQCDYYCTSCCTNMLYSNNYDIWTTDHKCEGYPYHIHTAAGGGAWSNTSHTGSAYVICLE